MVALCMIVVALLPVTLASADQRTVMFFPLYASETGNNLMWLSEGVPLAISRQLRGLGLKIVDRSKRQQIIVDMDLPPIAHLSYGSMILVGQQAGAELVVCGEFSGNEASLAISLKILDVQSLKFSDTINANGSVLALPQMENDLAWLVLMHSGVQTNISRDDFSGRMRKIANSEYAAFIQGLNATGRSERIRLLKKAVASTESFPEAHFELGKLYFQQEDWDGALAQLARSTPEMGKDLEYDFIRGTCLIQKGLSAEALEVLSPILNAARSYQVLNNIGVAYLRMGEISAALSAFMEAIHISPADTMIAANLAITRHLEGNNGGARTLLEDVLVKRPNNAILQFLLSVVLKELGLESESALAMERARELGLNVNKMYRQEPRTWTMVFTTMER